MQMTASGATQPSSGGTGTRTVAPLRSLRSTRGGRWERIDPRSQISLAPPSPQSSNLRVGPQLPLHIVTAGPEDDAGGAAGLELDETFAQLLARACEGHLFGGGYVDKCVMAVRNIEVMTAVNGEVPNVFVHTFDAGQPRFAVRRRLHAFRVGRVPGVIGERDERFDGGRGARRGDVLPIIEDRAASGHEASLEPFGRSAERNQAIGNLFG